MAVENSAIISVRISDADGNIVEVPWDRDTWYLVRDDQPYLDILVAGVFAQAEEKTKLLFLKESARGDAQWQRWDLGPDLARKRRFGEASLQLKVPEQCELRCYLIPTALLNLRDVISMVEDIENELGISAAWDFVTERPDRSWSQTTDRGRISMPRELLQDINEEYSAALSIRRNPFAELRPHSRRGIPLVENAVVSHWVVRRFSQLQDVSVNIQVQLELLRSKVARENPEGRINAIAAKIAESELLEHEIESLMISIASLRSDHGELNTFVHPGPSFQRDHRLRLLLRAFAPLYSETLSELEASRSHYPPVYLNHLWELWGAVWLAKTFRCMGFNGTGSTGATNSCSWRLTRDDVTIELDFESEPTYVDYQKLPPAHRRSVPAFEWAALNQELDPARPFLGSEQRCSPDYLLRITTRNGKFLVVGDAALATPSHHSKRNDSKPQVVERYRRTIGWFVQGEVVRCHPMGGFVLFPPPSDAWTDFERLIGAGDCTLLSPSPRDATEATSRLHRLLMIIAPELGTFEDATLAVTADGMAA